MMEIVFTTSSPWMLNAKITWPITSQALETSNRKWSRSLKGQISCRCCPTKPWKILPNLQETPHCVQTLQKENAVTEKVRNLSSILFSVRVYCNRWHHRWRHSVWRDCCSLYVRVPRFRFFSVGSVLTFDVGFRLFRFGSSNCILFVFHFKNMYSWCKFVYFFNDKQ